MMKNASRVFLLSILISYIFLLLHNEYEKILLYIPLFLTGSIALFVFNLIFVSLLKLNTHSSYPIAFILSIIVMNIAIAWLSGNSFVDTIIGFYKSNDQLTFGWAYTIANFVVYIFSWKMRD
ncbi:hypothetical protein A9P82_14010 [Arachidicoccus ginsenosidimutans]|nr:hypothetical protein A9P82_14010 [Arachidicoccus sp. BS20]